MQSSCGLIAAIHWIISSATWIEGMNIFPPLSAVSLNGRSSVGEKEVRSLLHKLISK